MIMNTKEDQVYERGSPVRPNKTKAKNLAVDKIQWSSDNSKKASMIRFDLEKL